MPKLVSSILVQKIEEWKTAGEAYLHFTPRIGLRYITLFHFLSHPDMQRFLFVDQSDIKRPQFARLFTEFAPTDIKSSPSLLVQALESIAPFSYQMNKRYEVRTIYLAYELADRRRITLIANAFPKSVIRISYSSSETGPIGVSCSYLLRRVFGEDHVSPVHPNEDSVVEICEPDTGELGEIMVTTPERKRHRTGDMGKLLKEQCACGATETLLVHGRFNHDVIHTAGATIFSAEVERVLGPISLLADYLVEVEERDVAGRILPRLHCQAVLPENAPPELAGQIADALVGMFVTKTRTLGQLVQEGLFLETVVRVVPELPFREKKVRLRRMRREGN